LKFSIGFGGFPTFYQELRLIDLWEENHHGNKSSKQAFSSKSSDSQEQKL
jgi:hypothetical protein